MDRDDKILQLQAQLAEEMIIDIGEKIYDDLKFIKADRETFVKEFTAMTFEGYDFSVLKDTQELVAAIEHNISVNKI